MLVREQAPETVQTLLDNGVNTGLQSSHDVTAHMVRCMHIPRDSTTLYPDFRTTTIRRSPPR